MTTLKIPHRIRSSNSSVIFWFPILLSFFLYFIFSSLSLFSGWASNIESFGGFHVFWGQSVRGFACFAAAIFMFFYVVYWLCLVFALEEGGGGSQLKNSVAFPLVVCSVH